MTIGFSYVPEGLCVLSDCGNREGPGRLQNLALVCGVMGETLPDDVAVVDEAGDKVLCDNTGPRFRVG